ncbi:hypothetical protein HALLA_12135 [Halostagnicola larsenii XH-48]|uniref:Uncharacterized protein n=1 Tax=Halostagnicola larsenii XH-48 TaxID=797299 RepID=W0JUK5_9EURY|nr:hypothetical protein [Halostagnicola larsenii]AHG00925.1 hypothetical protein HALLA_11835 [Halostagnicola larsenii XH-48]AHG00974.1 hypothetical protein HALLA_12135 [Halostagnicola larsenii XH-48]
MALACDLTNSWPSEAREKSLMDRVLAAKLKSRLYNEEAKRFET